MGLDKPETGRGDSDDRRQRLSRSEGKGEASEDGPRFSSTSGTDSRVLDSGAVIQANADNERMVLTAYARGRETKGNQVAKVDCTRTRSGAVEAQLEASSTAAGHHLRSELIGQVEHTAAVAGATEVRFREQASTDGKRQRLVADWEDRGYDTFVDDDEVVAIRYLSDEPVDDAAIPSGPADLVCLALRNARSLQRQSPTEAWLIGATPKSKPAFGSEHRVGPTLAPSRHRLPMSTITKTMPRRSGIRFK